MSPQTIIRARRTCLATEITLPVLAEVDDSIVMDDAVIDVERKLVRSVVGKGTKILNANVLLPKGQRLVIGENTTIYL